MPKWWDALSADEQEDYLKEHPRSKLKVKRSEEPEEDEGDDDEEDTDEEKGGGVAKAAKGILSYVKENPGKVALALGSTLLGMNDKFERDVDGMPVKKRNGLASAIRTAIHLKDSKTLGKLSYRFGISMGVLFVGATAFSLVTGVNVSLAVPILANEFWDKIKDAPDEVTYLKNAGKAYIEQVKQNLDNEDAVKKAVTNKKPDVVADTDAETASANIRKHFSITSSHESDLVKTVAQIEKAALSVTTDKLLETRKSSKKATGLIDHMSYLERTMPLLTTIMVAGISVRGNLASRANEQLRLLSKDYSRCAKELAEIAGSDKSLVKTPAVSKLKNLLNHSKVSSASTYVQLETGCMQACEVHTFDKVEAKDHEFNNVSFYTFKDKSSLCIAATVNSVYIPKTFENIKISELPNWLEKNNFR